MSIDVRWLPTEHAVYAAIYAVHHDDLGVFGTHTCSEGCVFHSDPYMLTEWGFKGADAPLIRSIRSGGRHTPEEEWTYWIASAQEERE